MIHMLTQHSELMVGWLKNIAAPIWFSKGFDSRSGLFHENLDRDYKPVNGARRSMVQARQIYVLSSLIELGVVSESEKKELVAKIQAALETYISTYQFENGSFSHAVDDNLVRRSETDLYAQSFAFFVLARGFALTQDPKLEEAAKKLLSYLMTERKLPQGGFSEIENGKAVCRSNPHMHLFEAAIEWMNSSKQPSWSELGAMLFKHFEEKILADRKMIAEEFDDAWKPVLNGEGAYFFEPGHHCEWAWLILRYADLAKLNAGNLPQELFESSNKFGLQKNTDIAVDQVWSDGKVKSHTARFWPQAERAKAASLLARKSSGEKRDGYIRDCLRSVGNLMDYLKPLDTGLWTDTRDQNGAMIYGNAKASSLYHIAGAILELNALNLSAQR